MIADDTIRAALAGPEPTWRSRPALRDAAVLVPWLTRAGEDRLLYTVRQAKLPLHAGEISFPGGARESDEDAVACALRETREEIGLDPGRVRLLGRLPDHDSVTGYCVHPFVGRIPPDGELVADPVEVAEILEIPVALLAQAERWEFREWGPPGRQHLVGFFEFEARVLWGLTARITLDLLARLGLR
ncbi:MAG: CoA pyrophosphatase [Acidobacteria bacterium]|nr:CoA pyrophosphatase [Acidobacteriota bacterium]